MRTPLSMTVLALASALLLSLPAQADLTSNLRHVPAKPDSLVSLSTDYEAWSYFLTRKPFSEMYAQLRKDFTPDLEKHLGMSFDRDLAPMLGTHLNLAVYDEEISSGKEVLPLLLIFDLKNTQGYPKLLQRFRDLAAKDKSKKLLEAKYRGISIYGFSSVRRSEGVPYMALSGKTLLFGSKNLVMKAIDSGQGKQASALNDSAFKVAHESLQSHKLWAYLDPESAPMLFKMVSKPPKDAAAQADFAASEAQLRESLAMYDSLGLGMDLGRNGLVFKTVVRIKEQGGDAQQRALMQDFARLWNDPKAPMRRLLQGSPAQPMLFAGFNGLQLMDQSMMLFSATDPDSEAAMEALGKEFTALTHLDFRKDVLRYSDGRSGVAVFYPENTKVFDRPPQMVFFLGVKDNPAFLQTLTQKLQLNLGRPEANQPEQIITFPKLPSASYEGLPLFIADNNQTVTTLSESLFVRPAYSNVGDVWLFASNPDALKAGIDYLKGKNRNLLNNPYFKQLTDRYGIQANGSMMYIDLATAHQLIEFLGGEDSEVKALKPTLSAFKSIMAGGSFQGNVAEGMMIIDIDMDNVNFELLSKFFKQKGKIMSDPTRRRPGAQPTPNPTPKPQSQLPHQTGL